MRCPLRMALVWSLLVAVSPRAEAAEPEMDSQRLKKYLTDICAIGRRYSGSEGMRRQQQVVTEHFERHRGAVFRQEFDAPHPLRGTPVRMTNLIVVWRPQEVRRILLACHYDTRPFPDLDRRSPRGLFVGANDGASGVAVMMELAHHMQQLPAGLGIDFVLFDGEELVMDRKGKYFLGSEHFAQAYIDQPPQYTYEACVLIDMVADRNLSIFKERNSVRYAPELTNEVWAVARQLGVREFNSRVRHEVRDDHLPLNRIAKIPTCDVIDFDYPVWHTTRDTPQQCSGRSMSQVARVVYGWFQLRINRAAQQASATSGR